MKRSRDQKLCRATTSFALDCCGQKTRRLAFLLGWVLVCKSHFVAGSSLDIVIEGNPVLQDLQGLEGVIALNTLTIKSNPGLTDLDPLKNLEQVAGALDVQTNDNLTDCAALAPVLGWPDGEDKHVGSANISGNPATCSSEEEILENVLGPTAPLVRSHSFNPSMGAAGDLFVDIDLDFDPAVARSIFRVFGHRATCSSYTNVYELDLAIPLSDFQPVSRTLGVGGSSGSSQSSFVADIKVGVDITHTDPVDLLVMLQTPNSVDTILWDRASPGSENLVGTFPIDLSPKESLSALASQQMGGGWTLVVEDVGAGPIRREGALNGWGLQISETSVTNSLEGPPITIQERSEDTLARQA